MSKVVGLRPNLDTPPGEPNDSVVRVLEKALEEARRGEIVAVAIVRVKPNRMIGGSWSEGQDRHLLLAGALYLQRDLIEAADPE